MKFEEKQMHPWSCDMSRGDTQCPFVSPSGGGILNCTWRIGHPADLPHEIVHDQTTPPPKRDWFISAESLEEYADAIRGPELARAASAVDQGLRKAAQDANEALRNILNGNDLALERGQSIENWKDSPFRKQGNDAYHALREFLTRQDGPVIGDEQLLLQARVAGLTEAADLCAKTYHPNAEAHIRHHIATLSARREPRTNFE